MTWKPIHIGGSPICRLVLAGVGALHRDEHRRSALLMVEAPTTRDVARIRAGVGQGIVKLGPRDRLKIAWSPTESERSDEAASDVAMSRDSGVLALLRRHWVWSALGRLAQVSDRSLCLLGISRRRSGAIASTVSCGDGTIPLAGRETTRDALLPWIWLGHRAHSMSISRTQNELHRVGWSPHQTQCDSVRSESVEHVR